MPRFGKLSLLKSVMITLAVAAIILMSTTQESMAQPVKYDGTKGYVTLSLEHAFTSLLPAIQNMTVFNFTGEIPVVVAKVGTPSFMTWDQITAAKNSGFTIMSHTETHLVLDSSTPDSTVYYEVVQSKIDLQNHGFNPTGFGPANNVFTPYALALMHPNYSWTRIQPGIPNTLYSITHDGLQYGMPLALHHFGVGNPPAVLNNFAQIKSIIDSAAQNHTWVIFDFHRLTNDGTGYNSPPQLFWQVLQYIKQESDAGQIVVGSMDDGLGFSTSTTPTAPQPPASLTATTASSSQINLSWTIPSNNGGSTITGYMIERSADSGSTWSTIVPTTGSTGTTYPDTGLTAGTTYTYRVSAINAIGTSSPSNTASATTSTTTSPTTLTLNAITPASISWGTSVTVSGKLTITSGGAGLGGKTITFSGTGAANLLSVVTSSDGTFSASGASPSSILSGWTVQAHFAGDSQYLGADSAVNTYNTLIHSTVFWSLNVPASIPHGSIYTVDGLLKDSTTGLFLPSKTVTFTATSPIVIPNAVPDSTGKYSASGLVAPAAGSYNIQAHFAGDSLYTSSNSPTKVLKTT